MRKYINVFMLAWPVLICASVLINLYVIDSHTDNLVRNKSRAFFNLLQSVRAWNSSCGRVYVPVNEIVQPNPYLKHPQRDVQTVEGDTLTMVNPAYMTRLIAELAAQHGEEDVASFDFHITSLDPIRPANKADAWETQALKTFTKAGDEYFEEVIIDSVPTYRYMAPLVTGRSCLACHAQQGYKLGDIRGGISVSTPESTGSSLGSGDSREKVILIYLLIFVVGFFVLLYYRRLTVRYQRILVENNHRLHESNDTKDKLFNIISHDLRTPSANIVFLAQTLRNKQDTLSEEKRSEYVELILKAATRTQILLNNLLDWSRLQANRIQVRPARLNTHDVITAVIEQTQMQAESKNIKVIDMSEPQWVRADPDMFTTILRNLVSNGLKFSFSGQRLAIDAEKTADGKICISVRDTGVGMSEAQKAQLFKINADAKTTAGTNNEPGTGLGLMLCKEFVELNGGTIWVESEIDKGSIFYFTLPEANAA